MNIDPDKFRPLGKRVLVRRYSLPEQSAGGIYVLGRDYPTMGRVAATSEVMSCFHGVNVGDEVQWEIKADHDSKLVGPNILLLELDDLNLAFLHGRAFAANDRILLGKVTIFDQLARGDLLVKDWTKFSVGKALSVGIDVPKDLKLNDHVLAERSFASEIYLNNERHLIVRYEHCVAVVEDE